MREDQLPEVHDAEIVLALAIIDSPEGGRDIWAGMGSGLYRSKDNGVSWTSAYDALALDQPLATTAVAAAPLDESRVSLFAGVPGAMLASSDGGASWHVAGLGAPPPVVSAIAVSPGYTRDGTVIAATLEDGMIRSTDRGQSWASNNFGLLDLGVLSLAISPAFTKDEMIFAGTDTGLYVSSNGGRAWRELDSASELSSVQGLALSPCFGDDGTLFAATENRGLWRSEDRGGTWSACAGEFNDRATIQISLDPSFPARSRLVLLTDEAVFWSGDHAATWSMLPGTLARGVTTFVVDDWGSDPPSIFAGEAGGQVVRIGSCPPVGVL